MTQHNGNGNGRNVAVPDENRPDWRPQDDHVTPRNRHSMSEDDRYRRDHDDDQYAYRGYDNRGFGHAEWRSADPRLTDRRDDRGGDLGHWVDRSARNYMQGYGDVSAPRGSGLMMHRIGYGNENSTTTGPSTGHRGKGPSSFQRSDERIRESVCEMLTEDDRIDATDIEVAVKAGEVTLTGTALDRPQKRMAEDVAENVSGVKDVQNQIRVGAAGKKGSPGPSDNGHRLS